jgi:hypothetical protein
MSFTLTSVVDKLTTSNILEIMNTHKQIQQIAATDNHLDQAIAYKAISENNPNA